MDSPYPSTLSVSLLLLGWLSPGLRPSTREVEAHAQAIMAAEDRPQTALSACRMEAELHLWVARCWQAHGAGPAGKQARSRSDCS